MLGKVAKFQRFGSKAARVMDNPPPGLNKVKICFEHC